MDIEAYYQQILTQLNQGSRALVRYSSEERDKLTIMLEQALSLKDLLTLEKLLCLVDHSASDYAQWEQALMKALGLPLPPKLMVFTLNCSRKHIIQARHKKGHRLSFEYLEALKKLLFSPSPEVVEWTLRTIDECGGQGVYFLQEFDKIKPPPWKWFNANQRAVREIIAMLEKRWSHIEKP